MSQKRSAEQALLNVAAHLDDEWSLGDEEEEDEELEELLESALMMAKESRKRRRLNKEKAVEIGCSRLEGTPSSELYKEGLNTFRPPQQPNADEDVLEGHALAAGHKSLKSAMENIMKPIMGMNLAVERSVLDAMRFPSQIADPKMSKDELGRIDKRKEDMVNILREVQKEFKEEMEHVRDAVLKTCVVYETNILALLSSPK